jgi:hypothetical protein
MVGERNGRHVLVFGEVDEILYAARPIQHRIL